MHKLPEPILHAIESGRVPSPPQLLLRLLQMVDDDQTSVGDLAKLVRQDPGLSTRVLSIANSPALRRGSELRSLENCLTALGTRLVRSIATCLSIQNLFERRSGISATDLSGFWVHSLIVAELSRSLAVSANHPHPEEAYLAGLLHDIGELILLSALGEPYAQLLASTSDEDALQAMETAQFGVHHGEIGTWLTDKWHLDSSFADGILFHHAKLEEIVTADLLPQIVWLAHAIAASEEIAPEMVAFHQQIANPPGGIDLEILRQRAETQTKQISEALGFTPPEKVCALQVWKNLQVEPHQQAPEISAESELSSMIGGMALLQPLQQDLFELESDAEVLLSLKESARILFDLNRLAFLLYSPTEKKLSGASIGDQPAIFRQVKLHPEEHRSLVSAAAFKKKIQCSFDPQATPQNALIDIQFARALGSAGLLCIPMIGRNRIAGVMVCGLSQAQFSRLSRRLPWLLNFGRIATISLDSLQEAKDYRQQAEHDAASRFNKQARRVIHEAGNPLGIIKSYLKILDHKLPAEAGVRQELEVLNEEIDRVAGIVGRMNDIPKDQAPANGLDAGELVNELLLLYGDALFQAKGIKFEVSQPAESLRVKCERDSLKQILLNLWKNASEALVSGQQIKISLTDHVVHSGHAYIQVRMDDNGPGMSDAAMHSIHHPVDANRTGPRGLGLSIVGTLATRQGIPITCRSQAGKGTSIALLIPKFGTESSAADAPRSSLAVSGQACGVTDK